MATCVSAVSVKDIIINCKHIVTIIDKTVTIYTSSKSVACNKSLFKEDCGVLLVIEMCPSNSHLQCLL